MEKNTNTNIKNEVVENAKVSTITNEKDTMKAIKLNAINLDREQILIHDEELAKISLKGFGEMSQEELERLTWCKAKVVSIERKDRYNPNNSSVTRKAMFILCDGVVIEKYLSDVEFTSIKNFNPDLICDGKAKVKVPVKLNSFIDKTGKRVFVYTACLSDGVYMGTSKNNRLDNGFIVDKVINNIIAFNLANKSKDYLQVRFVDIDQERIVAYRDTLDDDSQFSNSLENF